MYYLLCTMGWGDYWPVLFEDRNSNAVTVNGFTPFSVKWMIWTYRTRGFNTMEPYVMQHVKQSLHLKPNFLAMFSPFNFILWGNKYARLRDLKENIRRTIAEVESQLCESVIKNFTKRMVEIMERIWLISCSISKCSVCALYW